MVRYMVRKKNLVPKWYGTCGKAHEACTKDCKNDGFAVRAAGSGSTGECKCLCKTGYIGSKCQDVIQPPCYECRGGHSGNDQHCQDYKTEKECERGITNPAMVSSYWKPCSSCYPSTSVVKTISGRKQMKDLRVGDMVYNGSEYEAILGFTSYRKDTMKQYFSIQTSDSKNALFFLIIITLPHSMEMSTAILQETDVSKKYSSKPEDELLELRRINARLENTAHVPNVLSNFEEYLAQWGIADGSPTYFKDGADQKEGEVGSKNNEVIRNYIEAYPKDYKPSIVVDPCRGKAFDCCKDTYGAPEYFERFPLESGISNDVAQENRVCFDGYGLDCLLDRNNRKLENHKSRLAYEDFKYDTSCDGDGVPTYDCVGKNYRRVRNSLTPRCWDRNDTVVAHGKCRDPVSGLPQDRCMEIGYSQTAFIVECGGQLRGRGDCGTYLEVHLPGNPEILSEAPLPGGFTSGYRMFNLPLTYKNDITTVLCEGDYEVWWTQRQPGTLDSYVELKKKFRVVSPKCLWDSRNQKFSLFANYDLAVEDQKVAEGDWIQYITWTEEGFTANKWVELVDEYGAYFVSDQNDTAYAEDIFVNRRTGQSQWEKPNQKFVRDQEWLNITDTNTGQQVYLNRRTGVSQWEDPTMQAKKKKKKKRRL
eukprot:g4129.t1